MVRVQSERGSKFLGAKHGERRFNRSYKLLIIIR